MNDLDPLKLFVRQAMSHPILTAEEERRLGYRVRAGDRAAVDALVEHNVRLVHSIARRYMHFAPLMDLMQEGCIGLIRAAEKFDPDLGFKFSTYATWWIRQAVQRALPEHTHASRLPSNISAAAVQLAQASRALDQELGREPTVEEIADAAGVDRELAERLIALKKPMSLNAALGDSEDEFPLADTFDVDEEAALSAIPFDVESALASLDERTAEIVRHRYGVGRPQLTLAEVGLLFGITRERVRQIQLGALKKLAADKTLRRYAA